MEKIVLITFTLIILSFASIDPDFCNNKSTLSSYWKSQGWYCSDWGDYSIYCGNDGNIIDYNECVDGCETGCCINTNYCTLKINSSSIYCKEYVNYSIDHKSIVNNLDKISSYKYNTYSNYSNCTDILKETACLSTFIPCDDKNMTECNNVLINLNECLGITSKIECKWSDANQLQIDFISFVISIILSVIYIIN